MNAFMKLALLLTVVTILGLVSTPAQNQNCPARCQSQIDELKKRVNSLENTVSVMRPWRSPSPKDPTMTFNDLKLIPQYAVVGLFQWDWNNGQTYGLNPMPSVMVWENSTAVMDIPTQQDPKVNFSVLNVPCRISVTLLNKTLSYKKLEGCPPQETVPIPAFNVVFTFSTGSKP
jgi:hypothetical protein